MSDFQTITPDEVKEKLAQGDKLHLVDVREDDEVAEGMIAEAKHIPMGEIPEKLDQFDKNNEYIIVCRSGGRSGRVCQFLHENGYKVVNMEGGMLNWTGETKPKL